MRVALPVLVLATLLVIPAPALRPSVPRTSSCLGPTTGGSVGFVNNSRALALESIPLIVVDSVERPTAD